MTMEHQMEKYSTVAKEAHSTWIWMLAIATFTIWQDFHREFFFTFVFSLQLKHFF